jgi:hypothetical protein
MKINQKILSIPPYISTSWKNVISLHMEETDKGSLLVIGLVNGSTIEIPNLDRPILEATFASHEKHLEQEASLPSEGKEFLGPIPNMDPSALLSVPISLGIEGNMGNLLQHNSEAAESPDLPSEVIEKITAMSKAIGFDNLDNFPKPEPHCNCMHCQIMRALRKEEEATVKESAELDEEVSDDDLRFREWDIIQSGDALYVVSNPLNVQERYNVFLGNPVGCTCGESNCQHIRAVLNS